MCVMCRPLCEPCRGCEFIESRGWELWTPGRGRSAWWRHPCWMIIFYIFSNQDVNFFPSHSLDTSSFQLPSRMAIVRTFSSTFIQGRDATRTSHIPLVIKSIFIFSPSDSLDNKPPPYSQQQSTLCHSVCFLDSNNSFIFLVTPFPCHQSLPDQTLVPDRL